MANRVELVQVVGLQGTEIAGRKSFQAAHYMHIIAPSYVVTRQQSCIKSKENADELVSEQNFCPWKPKLPKGVHIFMKKPSGKPTFE